MPLSVLLVVLFGCGDDVPIRPDMRITDTGVRRDLGADIGPSDAAPDVPVDPRDFDGDGVCNDTEISRGTDPNVADSDQDGIPDGIELQRGFDPIDRGSPGLDAIDVLREGAAGIQGAFEVNVFGFGEDFSGAFDASFVDDNGDSANLFYDSSIAAFAAPEGNAGAIRGETVRAVQGRTLLGFEVRFTSGDNPVRGCNRALPYVYNVKRSDGVLTGIVRRVLVVLPERATREDPWCMAAGCF